MDHENRYGVLCVRNVVKTYYVHDIKVDMTITCIKRCSDLLCTTEVAITYCMCKKVTLANFGVTKVVLTGCVLQKSPILFCKS